MRMKFGLFLVYFQGGQYPLVEFDWFTFFWFTSREGSTNWLWFTLVYLQTIDGLLIFGILLVYSGLLGLVGLSFRIPRFFTFS